MSNNMRSLTIISIVICFALVTIDACKRKKTLPANAEVNTSFENTPPIASDITITILDKPLTEGNVLLEVRFDSTLIKEKFHAIMVADEKLVLRDDGDGGDAKAGDHIFSVLLQEDIQQFRKDLAAQARKLSGILAKNKQLFKFVNRSAVPITEQASRFIASNFDTSQVIRIPPDIFLATEPDPLLNDRSLMITNVGTIEDPSRTFNPCTGIGNPAGAWTFGKLMTDMANAAVTPENFVRAWLDTWLTSQTVNSDNIPARTTLFNSIIRPWIVRSNPALTQLQSH